MIMPSCMPAAFAIGADRASNPASSSLSRIMPPAQLGAEKVDSSKKKSTKQARICRILVIFWFYSLIIV